MLTNEPGLEDDPAGPAEVPGRIEAAPSRAFPAWKALLPLEFVVVSLIALAIVPTVVDRRIDLHLAEIEQVTRPARALITRVETRLAHEVSLTRGFLLTGDEAFLERYAEVHAEHRELYEQLRPLAMEMGPAAREHFVELERLTQQRSQATAAFLRGERTQAEFIAELPGRQRVFEEALGALHRLEQAVIAVQRRHREEMATLRRYELWITIGFVGLALASSLLILLIGRRDLRLLAEAEHRRRELAELVETRSRLIRGIGHDVKNPLGAADGYAELLEEGIKGELTPDQKEYLDRIRRMHRSILDIINNLLEFARAESGELSVELSDAHVDRIVRDTAEDYRGFADRAGLTLDVEVAADLDVIRTDPTRVRSIVGNLLSNAFKYTPSGGRVEVCTAAYSGEDAPRPGPWIVVEVADTGPGVPPHATEQIFREYSRLEPGVAEGAGIGLAISRMIARLLGGDITVRSRNGRGSVFTLWLPDQRGQNAPDAWSA